MYGRCCQVPWSTIWAWEKWWIVTTSTFIVASSAIDKKLENKLEIDKNLEIKLEIYKNLEIKLEIHSYFKLENKLEIFDFFVNGRWSQY